MRIAPIAPRGILSWENTIVTLEYEDQFSTRIAQDFNSLFTAFPQGFAQDIHSLTRYPEDLGRWTGNEPLSRLQRNLLQDPPAAA